MFFTFQVLESRQFDLLLGHIQADGVRTPGLVDRFNGQGVEAQQVKQLQHKSDSHYQNEMNEDDDNI